MNIHDIAKRSGFSVATVSRVLNNSTKVSASTREKILDIMKDAGYTPNAFARGLGLNSMNMIGILCTDVSDLYYAKAVAAVESHLRQQGFDSLLCCTGNRLADKQKYLSLLLQKRVDAIILIGSAFREDKDNSHIRTAAKQVPVIIINGLISLPNVYCLLCDEREAMKQNVQAFAAKGYRDILYLYDALTYSGMQKLQGYRDGLSACGIPERRELIRMTEKSVVASQAATAEALRQDVPFSAVLASEDLLAIGAGKALAAHRLSLPLIGFNNSAYAECATPPLTSVDNQMESLCLTAVRTLLDLLSEQKAPKTTMISASLIERDTFRMEELI